MKCTLFGIFTLSTFGMFAQKPEPKREEVQFTFDTDKPFTMLDLYQQIEEPIVTKKKKPKPKVFYGIKTKKGFTRKGNGDRVILELFYKLKKSEATNTFARDIYGYDFTRREVVTNDVVRGVVLTYGLIGTFTSVFS